MSRRHILTGIDIGNHAVKTVIAEFGRDTLRPQIIGFGSAPSNGLRRGVVYDMEETIRDIKESVSKAEAMAGVKINQAHVAINGLHIRNQLSRSVIVVSRADNEITRNDIDRVIEAASTINLPPNREIIHALPKSFTIDDQERVKNPLGMHGVRLEAEVLLIEALSPYIRNLAKCVNANNIEVAGFVFAPLAVSKSVLDKHQREHGVLCIDFGGGVSSMTLFHEGDLAHAAVLPVGSRHITNDIAVAFRTSMDKAEEIKCQYGFTGSDPSNKKDKIDLSDLLGEDGYVISRNQIAKIIDYRTAELFDMVTEEMKKIQRGYLLPAGIVLAGGGANLAGLPNLTKNRLRLSVRIGNDYGLIGLSEQISDPAFAVAIGLVLWGFEEQFADSKTSLSSKFSSDTASKLTRWLKNFLP